MSWDVDQDVDLAFCKASSTRTGRPAWSGVTVGGGESFDGVWLRLTGGEPGTCRIAADPAAVTTGLCTPAIPSRTPALIQHGSLAYLALRPRDDDGPQCRWELGAIQHGPAGRELADRIRTQIQEWDQARAAQPTVRPTAALTADLSP